ncbi:MAG TPA: glycosyltransferase, partial [Gammaproteobacteria bacterium]|nr:glycosyltransferase [Gammaproteobacteria bacterium]
PYPYLAHASLFALSSRWEGFGNVLVEALALGTPVVATDCRSGPREILADGALGPLVPPGDAEALAAAMAQVLTAPLPATRLRAGAERYTLAASVADYTAALGLDGSSGAAP